MQIQQTLSRNYVSSHCRETLLYMFTQYNSTTCDLSLSKINVRFCVLCIKRRKNWENKEVWKMDVERN